MYRIPNRIFVGGIPQSASQDELRDYFSHFGHVKDARIITDPRGNSRGYGFVTYESEADASKVLSLKEEELVFKENKLNIGHAYRKKNNFASPQQQQQQGQHQHHQSSNYGHHHHQMNQMNGMGSGHMGGHHQMSNHGLNNNYLDAQVGNMHQMQQGSMSSGFGQPNQMGMAQMNGHLGMGGMSGLNGLNGMGHLNHMNGLNGMSAISGMNMN